MRSVGTPTFWRLYRGLPARVRRDAVGAYRLFRRNPAHPGLSMERLRSDPASWSVRVSRGYRAVGTMQGETMVWYWVGNHDDFDRRFPA